MSHMIHDRPSLDQPALTEVDDGTSHGDLELLRDQRERLLASERERLLGRQELHRQGRELALIRRLLAHLLGTPRPGLPPGTTAAPTTVSAARVLAAEILGGEVVFSLDRLERGPTHVVVTGWAFHPGWDAREVDTFLLFTPVGDVDGTSPGRSLAAPAWRETRPDVAAHFAAAEFPGITAPTAGRHLEACGFRTLVANASLPPGIPLAVTLHLERGGTVHRWETEQQVVI